MNRITALVFGLIALLTACKGPDIVVGAVPSGVPSPAVSTTPTPPPIVMDDSQRLKDCSVYDAALATLTGTVRDENGQPVAGVRIMAMIPGEKASDPCSPNVGLDAVWQDVTGVDGTYTLQRTRPSAPLLIIATRGTVDVARLVIQPIVDLQGTPGANRYDISIRSDQSADSSRATMVGAVLDRTTRERMDSVSVTAKLSAGQFPNGSDGQTVLSGPYGQYRFAGVPMGASVTLLARSTDGRTVSAGPLKLLDGIGSGNQLYSLAL